VLAEGMRRAGGKTSRESLIAGLESISNQSFGGFQVNFSATDHVASSFVELSMLTGDGRVRT
jgi:branched-chain amino acid transport system substrate-binding protein